MKKSKNKFINRGLGIALIVIFLAMAFAVIGYALILYSLLSGTWIEEMGFVLIFWIILASLLPLFLALLVKIFMKKKNQDEKL